MGQLVYGDPSGKTDMRQMMTREEINNNAEKFRKQLSQFLDFEGENAAIFINNSEWLLPLNFVDFMREIGSLFSVNRMLSAECYKQRRETGLTFFELGYMLMQSYDFWYLYKNHNCKMQIGGNDQWSNIIGGVELIRKIEKKEAYGLTFKLLTTKEGKKMGKTEKGALWLDPKKTSPYEFYQYWRNIEDDSVKDVLCLLTFLPMDEIEKVGASSARQQNPTEINEAKKVLAFEITKLIHGEAEAIKAKEATEALFEGSGSLDNMPTITIEDVNMSILDAIVQTGIASSKGQAKNLISQGGISLNDEKVEDITYTLNEKDFTKGYAILKKGKKIYYKLEIR